MCEISIIFFYFLIFFLPLFPSSVSSTLSLLVFLLLSCLHLLSSCCPPLLTLSLHSLLLVSHRLRHPYRFHPLTNPTPLLAPTPSSPCRYRATLSPVPPLPAPSPSRSCLSLRRPSPAGLPPRASSLSQLHGGKFDQNNGRSHESYNFQLHMYGMTLSEWDIRDSDKMFFLLPRPSNTSCSI